MVSAKTITKMAKNRSRHSAIPLSEAKTRINRLSIPVVDLHYAKVHQVSLVVMDKAMTPEQRTYPIYIGPKGDCEKAAEATRDALEKVKIKDSKVTCTVEVDPIPDPVYMAAMIHGIDEIESVLTSFEWLKAVDDAISDKVESDLDEVNDDESLINPFREVPVPPIPPVVRDAGLVGYVQVGRDVIDFVDSNGFTVVRVMPYDEEFGHEMKYEQIINQPEVKRYLTWVGVVLGNFLAVHQTDLLDHLRGEVPDFISDAILDINVKNWESGPMEFIGESGVIATAEPFKGGWEMVRLRPDLWEKAEGWEEPLKYISNTLVRERSGLVKVMSPDNVFDPTLYVGYHYIGAPILDWNDKVIRFYLPNGILTVTVSTERDGETPNLDMVEEVNRDAVEKYIQSVKKAIWDDRLR